jgi:broad specificity phosphatase PhoE
VTAPVVAGGGGGWTAVVVDWVRCGCVTALVTGAVVTGAVVKGAVVVGAVAVSAVAVVSVVVPGAVVAVVPVVSFGAADTPPAKAKPAAASPAAASAAATCRRERGVRMALGFPNPRLPNRRACQAAPMSQLVVLVRHGETDWSLRLRHTGRTDVPLTEDGRREAEQLGRALRGRSFARVLSSPLKRASETAWLTGFGERAEYRDALMEWDYGKYEGETTVAIRRTVPDWTIWRYGAPDGESPQDVSDRADSTLKEVRAADGDVLIFSHGHFLRVLTARWLGLAAADGRLFALDPATLSMLGYEREQPVIRIWNNPVDTG